MSKKIMTRRMKESSHLSFTRVNTCDRPFAAKVDVILYRATFVLALELREAAKGHQSGVWRGLCSVRIHSNEGNYQISMEAH